MPDGTSTPLRSSRKPYSGRADTKVVRCKPCSVLLCQSFTAHDRSGRLLIVAAVCCFHVASNTNALKVQVVHIACWFTPLAPRKTNQSGLEATLTLT